MTTETKVEAVAWLRDIDGTGSLHPCAKSDPGAIEFRPASAITALEGEVERLSRDALRYRQLKHGRRQPFGDTFIVKKFNRTFCEEEGVSWDDMERQLDDEIKQAALTKGSP